MNVNGAKQTKIKLCDKLASTGRNTLKNITNDLNVHSNKSNQVYNLDTAKTTIKELTENNTYKSNVNNVTKSYIKNLDNVKKTIRQTTQENNYKNTPHISNSNMVYSSKNNIRTNPDKEIIAKGRNFTPNGAKQNIDSSKIIITNVPEQIVSKRLLEHIPTKSYTTNINCFNDTRITNDNNTKIFNLSQQDKIENQLNSNPYSISITK